MPTFGTKQSAILAAVAIRERALHLGDLLRKPARVLCYCGEIISVSEFLKDIDTHNYSIVHNHSIVADDVVIEGEPAVQCYMHRDDVFNYNACIGMLNAQGSN